jgi:hypothetical protein
MSGSMGKPRPKLTPPQAPQPVPAAGPPSFSNRTNQSSVFFQA